MHGCMCECLPQSFPSGQAEAVLYFFLLSYFFKAEKKIPKHWTPFFTNTVPNLTAYCASGPGLWPPEQCHPLMKGGQAGWWVGERGEGWRRSAFPTLNITSHPPLAWSDLFLFLVMARWDAVRKGDTIWRRPYPTLPHSFKWFSQLRGAVSVWGAAVGGAGCGGHGHARGARGGHWLADVGHEEGVTGQLMHIDAVLLTVD